MLGLGVKQFRLHALADSATEVMLSTRALILVGRRPYELVEGLVGLSLALTAIPGRQVKLLPISSWLVVV